MLDRHLHHLPTAPAQQATHDIEIKTDLTESYYTLHFEHSGQADEFSYRTPEEIRERFADVLAREKDLPVSDAEGVLVRLFNRLDDEDEGDVVTGAALAWPRAPPSPRTSSKCRASVLLRANSTRQSPGCC